MALAVGRTVIFHGTGGEIVADGRHVTGEGR